MKPDVIVTNPYSLDYPYFTSLMERNRNKFGKIIIGFYNDYRDWDYRSFIKMKIPYAVSVDVGTIPDRQDWRNVAVNAALSKSTSKYVLFMEQDFVVKSELFWYMAPLVYYDVKGFPDQTDGWTKKDRLHPSFLMVRRNLVEKTSKNFSAYPDKGMDHFHTFTNELLEIRPKVKFFNIKRRPYNNLLNLTWKHYGGVSHNMMLKREGKEITYKPEEFEQYLSL